MGLYRTGQLDRKITIESVSSVPNSIGEPTDTWAIYKVVFAAIRPLKARERFRAERYIYEDFQFFVIRWTSGISQTMRIKYDDGNGFRYFNIRDIAELDDTGRRRWLEITGEAQT
jgi:SPP1 family predicted phage head-tail adaptor